MCSPFVRKEANRFNWIIKGKLIDLSWSDDSVEKTYHSYLNACGTTTKVISTKKALMQLTKQEKQKS